MTEEKYFNIDLLIEQLPQSADKIDNFQIKSVDLVNCAKYLKDKKRFDILLSVTGMDNKEDFAALYHFYSTFDYKNIILKVKIDKINPEIESLSSVYSSANWHEREVYDLLGIKFSNHPDLRRILLPDSWQGHPLRKDYKMSDTRLAWNER